MDLNLIKNYKGVLVHEFEV